MVSKRFTGRIEGWFELVVYHQLKSSLNSTCEPFANLLLFGRFLGRFPQDLVHYDSFFYSYCVSISSSSIFCLVVSTCCHDPIRLCVTSKSSFMNQDLETKYISQKLSTGVLLYKISTSAACSYEQWLFLMTFMIIKVMLLTLNYLFFYLKHLFIPPRWQWGWGRWGEVKSPPYLQMWWFLSCVSTYKWHMCNECNL